MTDTYRYEFRTAEGKDCCKTNDPITLCQHCKAALAAQDSHRYAPPNPYKAGLKALVALTSADPFEAAYKERRLEEFAAERYMREQAEPASAAELRAAAMHDARTNYAPPKPYDLALKAAKERGR